MIRKLSVNLILLLSLMLHACTKKDNGQDTMTATPDKIAYALAAAGSGSPDDTNIRYFGRWDFSDNSRYTSYWGGAYFKVNFTGTTVKLKTGNTSNFYARIDNGPWISYKNAGGVIDLTPMPLAGGTHTLAVAQGRDYDYLFSFMGLILDAGAATSKPSTGTYLIEYIGDSITAGYLNDQANVSDYAWICSEELGAEHTQIAYPGIALVSSPRHGTAMDAQYFRLQPPNYPSSPAWDFTNYTPQIVVLNLGTNDSDYEDSDSTFREVYTGLLAGIRSRFPQAEIFVMRTFLGIRSQPTVTAVENRMIAGDKKVHYINTEGWLAQSTADYLPDNLHPSEAGHTKAAALLKEVLAPYTGGGQAIPDGIYNIVNKNSYLALDATGQSAANETPLQQWTANNGENQRWQVKHLGNNQYQITGVQSGRALDITGQSLLNGAGLQLYDYNGGDNQKWMITAQKNGYYTITGVQSGKVLEITAQSTTPGARVVQYTNNGGNHQLWAFKRV
ncbi:RICIN domain-containing protein [Chitinophaga filiformis]|uniref:RICIN domain-containing protein n=1 Tax=Chitinophaga filiformis TaxID=104663 RepID=UPI001F17AEB7|nr:RICIN domain-containing protein [Chitinophaga filiformis]MCF6402805.1 RICIN domain-containing protein [Chitinophaga filiformis]MCF6403277.1 RICIN domain-containing protein [Chitinophaga filiformis]